MKPPEAKLLPGSPSPGATSKLYRYPDAFPEPGDEDLREALALAERLLDDVTERLFPRTSP